MNQNIFEDVKSSSAGTKIVRTLVNKNSVNYLKSFCYPDRIEMKGGEHSIMLNNATARILTPLENNEANYQSPEMGYWSLIALYHQNMDIEIDEIMNGFYEIVGNSYFLPIAYRRERNVDYFLTRNTNDAIRQLYMQKLQVQVKGWRLPIIIKLEVSNYFEGQIKAKRVVSNYLQRKIKESSELGILDLSNISKEPEFSDIYFSFKNKGVCKMFFDEMNSLRNIKSHSNFRTLKFCRNEMQSLEHFKILFDFKNIEVLDLSLNNIMDIKELINLQDLNIKDLIIVGNPCNNYPNLEDKIQKLLPRLMKLNSKLLVNDKMDFINFNSPQTGNNEISNIGDGILIKSKNFNTYRTRFDKLVNEHYWSQVILFHNKRFTMQEIIRELSTNLLKDVPFYPCYLKRVENHDEFFLCRSFEALRLLFLTGMKIQMPKNSFTIDLHIRLNVAEFKAGQVNWTQKVQKAVSNRIKGDLLDLNDFPRDPEFSKLTILMNSTKVMDSILTHALKYHPNITKIDMENCNISNCKGFEYLYQFTKLKVLNLRNNNIASLEGFTKYTKIEEIYLNGNPLCNQSSFEYIKHIRDHFKHIQFIDGHRVSENNCIVTYQNYIIDSRVYMAVSEFVSYFFNLWDSFERSKVLKLYDDFSIFTMSVFYVYDAKLSMTFSKIYPRIQNYIKLDRNLAKISNMGKTLANVFVGKEILKVFGDICRTTHDFSTITIDVPFYSELQSKIFIIVSGVFEEFANDSDENPLLFNFSRSFLVTIKDSTFTINNDKLLLSAPTAEQIEMAKKKVQLATKDDIQEQCRGLLPNEMEEQSMKVAVLQKLTECNKKYCTKLLQDNSWDLKVALACFTNYLEKNEIPDNKFIFNN